MVVLVVIACIGGRSRERKCSLPQYVVEPSAVRRGARGNFFGNENSTCAALRARPAMGFGTSFFLDFKIGYGFQMLERGAVRCRVFRLRQPQPSNLPRAHNILRPNPDTPKPTPTASRT